MVSLYHVYVQQVEQVDIIHQSTVHSVKRPFGIGKLSSNFKLNKIQVNTQYTHTYLHCYIGKYIQVSWLAFLPLK